MYCDHRSIDLCKYIHVLWFSEIVAAEMSESNMCSVFGDVNDVDWPLLSQKLCLTKEWIDAKCLKETLKRWHDKKWNPWTTWRKLAVVAGSVYGSKVGQKLRQRAGVGTYVFLLHELYKCVSLHGGVAKLQLPPQGTEGVAALSSSHTAWRK